MTSKPNYLIWHFHEAPYAIFNIITNFSLFSLHFFSVSNLLRTLFLPWKREVFISSPSSSLKEIIENDITNIISSLVGAFVRSITIFIGLSAATVILVFGLLFLGLWILLPAVTFPVYLLACPEDPFLSAVKDSHDSQSVWMRMINALPCRFIMRRLDSDCRRFYLENPKVNFKKMVSFTDFLEQTKTRSSRISTQDIVRVARWQERQDKEREQRKAFWKRENLFAVRPVTADWAYGYSPKLDLVSSSVSADQNPWGKIKSHSKEVTEIIRVLSKTTANNVLLVGQSNSGREPIIEQTARVINSGQVPENLKYRRVVQLSLSTLTAKNDNPAKTKGELLYILKEADAAGNILLVIPDFHHYASTRDSNIDFSDIFTQILKFDKLPVIATTTPAHYFRDLEPHKDLLKHFTRVDVITPDDEQTLSVIEDIAVIIESRAPVYIPYYTLKHLIKLTRSAFPDTPPPAKAITVLDELASKIKTEGGKKVSVITRQMINDTVSRLAKIPLGILTSDEKEILKNLEEKLHQIIVNQNHAVSEVASALRRSRLGVASEKKPLGAFLFLGPTGVGKTQTAKALAQVYFHDKNRLTRFDMNEYAGSEGIERLIGSFNRDQPGALIKAIKDTPFSVLLLDEIEKAPKEIVNLFLTLTDEGYMTDAFGNKISARNLIVIATSNAGSEFIRENYQKITNQELSGRLVDFVLRQNIFSPEFLNRFDAVVVFDPLTPDQLKQVAVLELEALNQRLKTKNLRVKITGELLEKIIREGYAPEFGARPMKRAIAKIVEEQIAEKLLSG